MIPPGLRRQWLVGHVGGTVVAGPRAGAGAKSAPTDPWPGGIRAPGRHSVAIHETEQWPTAGADGREAALPPDEEVVYLPYT